MVLKFYKCLSYLFLFLKKVQQFLYNYICTNNKKEDFHRIFLENKKNYYTVDYMKQFFHFDHFH